MSFCQCVCDGAVKPTSQHHQIQNETTTRASNHLLELINLHYIDKDAQQCNSSFRTAEALVSNDLLVAAKLDVFTQKTIVAGDMRYECDFELEDALFVVREGILQIPKATLLERDAPSDGVYGDVDDGHVCRAIQAVWANVLPRHLVNTAEDAVKAELVAARPHDEELDLRVVAQGTAHFRFELLVTADQLVQQRLHRFHHLSKGLLVLRNLSE